MNRILIVVFATLCVLAPVANSFAPSPSLASVAARQSSTTAANVFGKKKPQEDLSFIETRDMTRAEMEELNRKNEDIMNMELTMMTAFSLVLSLPILYLCWVAFFSE